MWPQQQLCPFTAVSPGQMQLLRLLWGLMVGLYCIPATFGCLFWQFFTFSFCHLHFFFICRCTQMKITGFKTHRKTHHHHDDLFTRGSLIRTQNKLKSRVSGFAWVADMLLSIMQKNGCKCSNSVIASHPPLLRGAIHIWGCWLGSSPHPPFPTPGLAILTLPCTSSCVVGRHTWSLWCSFLLNVLQVSRRN